jgi:SNF2 family DNA or RNA helicase
MCGTHFVPTFLAIAHQLFPFRMQVDGVQWLIKMYDLGLCGILGDEMGLGKTIQTITFLGFLRKFRGKGGPHLVVCPLSVMSSWEQEFNRWLPSMRVKKLHCSEADRLQVLQDVVDIKDYDVILTTYDMMKAKHVPNRLVRIKFRTMILDEGHCLKNELTAISTTMRRMNCVYVTFPTPARAPSYSHADALNDGGAVLYPFPSSIFHSYNPNSPGCTR